MQAQGSRALGLGLAASLASSLGVNALATWAVPANGWWLTPGVGLQVVENPGISFGLGSSLATGTVVALGAAALATAWYVLRSRAGVGLGLLLGGGLANLLDRVADGRVTDYVALGPWPSFNLADVCIVAGAALLLTPLLRRR